MISSIYVIEALLLLSGALNCGGVVPPTTTATLKIFFVQMGVRTLFRVHHGGDRGAADRPVEQPGSHISCLGVRTIGARLRLRSAAASWEPPQVYLFSFLTFL